MRHGKKFNHLGRKAAHRKAMLANMACSLIEHKRIKTTLAKAKALRMYVEPLLTKSKDDTTHSRRIVFSYLKQKQAITELFGDVAAKIADRPGGYTRILKLSNRLGDNAQMAFIELVDYNEEYTTDKPKRKKARRAKKKIVEDIAPVVEDTIIEGEIPTIEEVAVESKAAEDVVAEKETTEAVAEEVQVEDETVEVVEEKEVEESSATEEPTEEIKVEEEVVETASEITEEKEETPVEEIEEDKAEDTAEVEETEEENKADNPEEEEGKGE
jgi:large subunit ribosomal protein L17